MRRDFLDKDEMEVTGRTGKLNNRDIPRMYSSPDVSANTCRRVGGAMHVARMGKTKILKENSEEENRTEDIISGNLGYKITGKNCN